MKIFNDTDVLAHWDSNYGVEKTRKESYIDVRNYFIGLLYYKFKYIEQEIAEIFEIDRSTVNYSKIMPYTRIATNDVKFLKHVESLTEIFPYIFPKETLARPVKLQNLTLFFEASTMKSIRKFSKSKSRRANRVCADIIAKYMREWDV